MQCGLLTLITDVTRMQIAEDIQQQTNSLGELSGQEITTAPTKGIKGGNQSEESIVSITNADTVSGSINSWLDKSVSLPAGYQTTRRDALKFLSLGGAVGSGWVAVTRVKVRYWKLRNSDLNLSWYISLKLISQFESLCLDIFHLLL